MSMYFNTLTYCGRDIMRNNDNGTIGEGNSGGSTRWRREMVEQGNSHIGVPKAHDPRVFVSTKIGDMGARGNPGVTGILSVSWLTFQLVRKYFASYKRGLKLSYLNSYPRPPSHVRFFGSGRWLIGGTLCVVRAVFGKSTRNHLQGFSFFLRLVVSLNFSLSSILLAWSILLFKLAIVLVFFFNFVRFCTFDLNPFSHFDVSLCLEHLLDLIHFWRSSRFSLS